MVRIWTEAVLANFPEGLQNTRQDLTTITDLRKERLREYKDEELIIPPRHLLFGRKNKLP
jgi:hypothetical protein